MKRFLILLVVLAGGLAAASLSVPSNAATVNGTAITQSQLDSDISAIANTNNGLYACFLNAEELVATEGQSGLPSPYGAGQSAKSGTHTIASTAFVSTFLDTEIGQAMVLQQAAKDHLAVTSEDLSTGRRELEAQITSYMQDVTGTQYACSSASQPPTFAAVLAHMPKSFVDAEVRFNATFSVLEEYLSGVGSSTADLEGYFKVHHAMFDTACFTVAEYSSSSDAEAAIAQVHAGTPFATVVAQVPGAGPQGCEILYGISSELPTANLLKLPLNTVSAPISADGSYLVLEITSRTPTPFETAESEVQSAVQNAGADKARVVINSAERSAAVSVDPRYGTWKRDQSRIFVPAVPPALDVLNAVVNSPATATSTPTPGEAANPASGQSG